MYSKKQPVVQTATYGSEFMAARTTVEQIIDLRTTFRYLGVKVLGPTHMFGDNQSVVQTCDVSKGRIHKRHNLLSFHRVREAIAANIIKFTFIPGNENPADIVSKHWGYQQIWNMLKTMLFWEGDTDLIEY